METLAEAATVARHFGAQALDGVFGGKYGGDVRNLLMAAVLGLCALLLAGSDVGL